jgi:hypothetical protein
MIWSSLIGAAQSLGQYGEQMATSSDRWDAYTGKSKNKTTEAVGWMNVGSASLWKIWGSDKFTTGVKVFGTVAPGLGHFISGLRVADREEKARMEALAEIRGSLATSTPYERSEEASMMKDIAVGGGEVIKGLGKEYLDAVSQYGKQGVPGAAIRKEQLNQYARAAVDDYVKTGGASASSFYGILRSRDEQARSLINIAEATNARNREVNNMYINSLAYGAELETQAAMLKSKALQSGITEHERVYASEADEMRQKQQFELTLMGNRMAQ